VRSKRLHKPCFWTGPKLDKKSAVASRGSFAHSILWIFSSLSTTGRKNRLCRRLEASLVDVEHVSKSRACPESGNFFSGRAVAFEARRQVYNQKLVYRIIVIVNGATLLWISRVFSTTSNVYGPHKAVGWSCMCLVAKLDKNSDCAKNRFSPHFVPVDIHTLIHSPETPC
jgi:hypothetical protein